MLLLLFPLPALPWERLQLNFHGISEASVKSQPGLFCCEGSTSAPRHSWHSWGSTGHSRKGTNLCLALRLGEPRQTKAALKEQESPEHCPQQYRLIKLPGFSSGTQSPSRNCKEQGKDNSQSRNNTQKTFISTL